jgi:hypothetical protein
LATGKAVHGNNKAMAIGKNHDVVVTYQYNSLQESENREAEGL